jgi:hypothetical protein
MQISSSAVGITGSFLIRSRATGTAAASAASATAAAHFAFAGEQVEDLKRSIDVLLNFLQPTFKLASYKSTLSLVLFFFFCLSSVAANDFIICEYLNSRSCSGDRDTRREPVLDCEHGVG